MDILLKNKTYLTGMKPEVRQTIKQQLIIPNPKFYKAIRRGRYTGHLTCELKFYDKTRDSIFRKELKDLQQPAVESVL